jgi:AhpD family alkylhydroperoxidase
VWGILPAWARRLGRVPWVVRAFARTNEVTFAHMPVELWGWISLVVSQDNSCRYCYGVVRAILKVAGHRDESIDRLERQVYLAEISPAEQAALHFARKVSQAKGRAEPDARAPASADSGRLSHSSEICLGHARGEPARSRWCEAPQRACHGSPPARPGGP